MRVVTFAVIFLFLVSFVSAQQVDQQTAVDNQIVEIKADLAKVKGELRLLDSRMTNLANTTSELKSDIVGLRSQIANLKPPSVEMPQQSNNLATWPVIFLVVVNIIFLVYLLIDFLRFREKNSLKERMDTFEDHFDRLGEYIHKHLDRGFSYDQLKQVLQDAGWQDHHISYAYKKKLSEAA